MSEQNPLIVEREGHVLRLTLNRPERRNAITDELCLRLSDAILAAEDDTGIRCIVVTGSGDKAYCAGADLTPGDTPFKVDFNKIGTAYATLLRTTKASRLPMIARVNGVCMAGGMGILSMCDIAVAVTEARFGLPEVKIGLFPLQVAVLLQSILGPRRMAEMCITGQPISAQQALEYGLLNAVVPRDDLDSCVNTYVNAVIAAAPGAVRRGKYMLRRMEEMNFEQAMTFAETAITPMILADEAREGLAAFNERRAPSWINMNHKEAK